MDGKAGTVPHQDPTHPAHSGRASRLQLGLNVGAVGIFFCSPLWSKGGARWSKNERRGSKSRRDCEKLYSNLRAAQKQKASALLGADLSRFILINLHSVRGGKNQLWLGVPCDPREGRGRLKLMYWSFSGVCCTAGQYLQRKRVMNDDIRA